MSTAPRPYAAMAEFTSPAVLLRAVRALRAGGYRKIDALAPFPVHGIATAMGLRPSPLGWVALAAGLVGGGGALWLQWWTGAVDYPLVIGGLPLFAWEFAVPVTFELMVLASAFAVVGGLLACNGLPRLYHSSFNYSRSERATNDRFVVIVEAQDERFDRESTPELLRSLGGRHVELVEE